MADDIFNQVAAEYEQLMSENIGKYGKNIAYYAEYKILTIRKYLRHEVDQILEFGCGIGRNLPFLHKYFPAAAISAYDNSEESIKFARKENSQVKFLDSQEILKVKSGYELILVANVFHHIPLAQRAQSMRLIESLLKAGGELFIFEHNPLNPLTRKAVATCPFDKDALLLKPAELKSYLRECGLNRFKMNYCLFFPAALKRIRFVERVFTNIPLGGQYFIQVFK